MPVSSGDGHLCALTVLSIVKEAANVLKGVLPGPIGPCFGPFRLLETACSHRDPHSVVKRRPTGKHTPNHIHIERWHTWQPAHRPSVAWAPRSPPVLLCHIAERERAQSFFFLLRCVEPLPTKHASTRCLRPARARGDG
ncbi:hypothetical protein, unknown function [Leishmania donovani]|uniref:Uncharacterized protein n=1 Tax=Leishmania donovani TaxID=5661 RepID=E9BJI4_LEIDO|nr:hypothetical protein, unknown function [Leishmania donovani]CBZ35518.1 hypothetical protein, unknown function [Leishmania donovani]